MADAATCLTEGIDHVGLTVSDVARSAEFFVECLGWKKVGERPDYPAIYVSDGKSIVTLWQATSEASANSFNRRRNIGLHHLAFRVASREALQEVFERIRKWPGVVVEFAPEMSGAGPKVHAMCSEPGGTRIEFAWDPRRST